MLEMRPDCERCGADLPAEAPGAFICSFECTFCAPCADALDDRCPQLRRRADGPADAGEETARQVPAFDRAEIQSLRSVRLERSRKARRQRVSTSLDTNGK